MNMLDRYTEKQTAKRPYKMGSTVIVMVAILFSIGGYANENSQASNEKTPAAEKPAEQDAITSPWEQYSEKEMLYTLVDKKGRRLPVRLVKRSETEILAQKISDESIFVYKIKDLDESNQRDFEKYWDPRLEFGYVLVVKVPCGRRRCR